jgi:hypothetical protein
VCVFVTKKVKSYGLWVSVAKRLLRYSKNGRRARTKKTETRCDTVARFFVALYFKKNSP